MTNQVQDISAELSDAAIHALKYGLNKIGHCIKQLDDEQVWWRPQVEMNAIGNLLLHLAGNLGQWIVAGVGDQTDSRDRPAEFAARAEIPKEEVYGRLQDVVEAACKTLSAVAPNEWLAKKRIQGNEVTKLHAMMHSVTHFQGHVQEIIGMTRQQLGRSYEFEWAPETREEGAP